ncbi:MAG: methyltransferase [Thiotrichales bacterium SG8_50]|nr:MAG: methyltransferase [Thiotrichales bacterium SG8_50]
MSINVGTLYVVATPIGNLEDMSARAQRVLAAVDVVAAEDTRRTRQLLHHFGLSVPCIALHEHNELSVAPKLVERIQHGESVALVSDAGTPLLSDPGFNLVRAAAAAGVSIVPVPGASAMLCALCVSGLPTDRFAFEGFLPAKAAARQRRVEELAGESATLVFFESPHRIASTLRDMVAILGAERPAVLARELTKVHETVLRGSLGALERRVATDADQRRGEMVLLVGGAPAEEREMAEQDAVRVLDTLLRYLPTKHAVAAAAELTGLKKNALYALALQRRPSE